MKTSKSYQETHDKILTNLVELGQEKGLTKVKVTDITKQLSINRGTFYLHFLDMPDAIEQLEKQLFSPMMTHFREITTAINDLDELAEQTLYTKICQQIEQDFGRWQFLMGENGDPRFEQFLRQNLTPFVAPSLTKTDLDSFLRDLIVDSLISITRHWLLHKPHYPAPTIADILYQTRHQSPFQLAGMDEKSPS